MGDITDSRKLELMIYIHLSCAPAIPPLGTRPTETHTERPLKDV